MLQSITLPAIAHVGNPIWLNIAASPNETVHYRITDATGAKQLFHGSGIADGAGMLSVNIAGIVKVLLTGTALIAEYGITATAGNVTDTAKACCVSGGISASLYRELKSRNTDIFAERLLNNNSNRMLTSRTTGAQICIRETELEPLCFLSSGKAEQIEITAATTNETLIYNIAAGYKIVSIDIEEIRRNFFFAVPLGGNIAGLIYPQFDIKIDGIPNCSVIITPAAKFERIRTLKFRNSWGIYEKIELSGELRYTPEFGDNERYSRYDAVTDSYLLQRNRQEATPVYSGILGYKTPEELYFAHDMLLSEDIYLCAGGHEYPCLVDAEDATIADDGLTAGSISLKITLKDKETRAIIDAESIVEQITSQWSDFVCLQNAGVNTGTAAAKILTLVKTKNGKAVTGYPKIVSTLDAFTGYPSISEADFRKLSDSAATARLNDLAAAMATATGTTTIGATNMPVKTDYQLCPVSTAKYYFDIRVELVGGGTAPISLIQRFTVNNGAWLYNSRKEVLSSDKIKAYTSEEGGTALYHFEGWYNASDTATLLSVNRVYEFNVFADTTLIALWRKL